MIHAIVIAALVVTDAVAAQEPVDLRRDSRRGDLNRPLEEGVADVSALDASLRIIDPGLNTPTDFGEVYRVPGAPAMLMRIAGGMYAVFPQSVYSAEGAEIPPGTVFYIGGPPGHMPGVAPLPTLYPLQQPETFEDGSMPLRLFIPPENLGGGWTSGGAQATIANNALYRNERLSELMQRAADRAGGIGVGDDAFSPPSQSESN